MIEMNASLTLQVNDWKLFHRNGLLFLVGCKIAPKSISNHCKVSLHQYFLLLISNRQYGNCKKEGRKNSIAK